MILKTKVDCLQWPTFVWLYQILLLPSGNVGARLALARGHLEGSLFSLLSERYPTQCWHIPRRKHIGGTAIDDTMLLDAFLYSDSPARQF